MIPEVEIQPVARYTDMAGMAGKNTVFAFFHEVIDEDPVETKKQGRPIARSRVFLCKKFPGTTDEIDRPAKDKDKAEFATQWAQFEAKRPQTITGTALEMWPQMSRTQVFEMKALGIHTVEQLLALPDAVKYKIMGYQELARRAQAFLDATIKPKILEEERERSAKMETALKASEEKQAQQAKLLEEQGKKIAELTALVTDMAQAQLKSSTTLHAKKG